MGINDLKDFILPAILIAAGLFIKNTKDPNFQTSKKYWKVLFILGILNLLMKLYLMFFL
ncbi:MULTISPECIES: hypothetical protein [unclassified Flavobacterium]|jgi:hypothetical protein|uniref:hypothetical protein n=1 Tax=unclassified Flavobacterium TaxID=196869 RepID=UPI0013E9B24B|nr:MULTISPECIES: hypothetical protein [unclassified Flavobacterium]MCD0474885.1 hypothetical protein [Flavobacterium sp. EDS]